MRSCMMVVALLMAACQSREPVHAEARNWTAPLPVGFVGDWIYVVTRPGGVADEGDVLTLRADSSARGPMPGDYRVLHMATVSRWWVMFISHDSPTDRADWQGGFTDGGEYSCYRNPNENCRSGPLLCLEEEEGNPFCTSFKYSQDSLILGTGDRFVRSSSRTM